MHRFHTSGSHEQSDDEAIPAEVVVDDPDALFTRNARPARVEILLNDEARFTASIGDRSGEQLIPIVGYVKPVSRLRITIRGYYPGTDFEDTCIAQLILYDLLAKDPEIRHAR